MSEVPLTELVSTIIDNRGRSCPTVDTGFPLIATNCVRRELLYPSSENVRYIDDETYRTWFRGHPEPGDILFVCKGDPGRTALVPDPVPFAIAQDMVALRANPAKVDPRFLFYALRSRVVQERITNMHVGTMIPHFKKGDFHRLMVPLVDALPEQQAVAEVLGALDDKIAANTKVADMLLAVVNAEFVRRFGDRDLGVTLGALAEVIDCLHSKKPERLPAGDPLMQLNNIRDDGLVDQTSTYSISPEDYAEWSRRFETRAWDFVITNVGRIGAVARIPDGYVSALGRNMTGIRPKDAAESGSFIAAALMSSSVRREIDQRTDAGSVMNALNVRSVPLLRLQESTPSERNTFHKYASPFLEKADSALSENASLAATRDALLPKLMSGQLRVRDIENTVNKVL